MKFEKVSKETFKKAMIDYVTKFKDVEKNKHAYTWINGIVFDSFDNIDIIPKRSTASSAGYDFRSPFSFNIKAGESIIVPTGIKVKLDPDKVLMIAPRSSIGIKKHLKLTNTQAYIDADYYNNPDNEGHILLAITSENDKDILIEAGDKIAQGIIIQYFTTEDDDCKNVRSGGIGSTGK